MLTPRFQCPTLAPRVGNGADPGQAAQLEPKAGQVSARPAKDKLGRSVKTVAQINFVDLAGSERSNGVASNARERIRRKEVMIVTSLARCVMQGGQSGYVVASRLQAVRQKMASSVSRFMVGLFVGKFSAIQAPIA